MTAVEWCALAISVNTTPRLANGEADWFAIATDYNTAYMHAQNAKAIPTHHKRIYKCSLPKTLRSIHEIKTLWQAKTHASPTTQPGPTAS